MPDRVNAAMDAVKAMCSHATLPAALANACVLELVDGDDPVLPRSDTGDTGVSAGRAEFPIHIDR